MLPATSKTRRLIELADAAIAAAEKERSAAASVGKTRLVEDCDLALRNFRSIREQASAGLLPLGKGAGLGITRALGEWDVSTDLYSAGLENYYMDEYGA